MALYVAVCDSNAADRKQLERLLTRENDIRQQTSGVIYIDSYGSRNALMNTPIKYDLFLIDIISEQHNGMTIAKELRAMGILAPIVLCSSNIDYTAFGNPASHITCLQKPISKGQLSHLLDMAIEHAKEKTPLIEIRGENETHFVSHLDFVCACPKDHQIEITLKSGSTLYMLGSMNELELLIKPYHCFIYCKNTLVNLHHITGNVRNSFILSTGQTVAFHTFKRKELLLSLANFKNSCI